MSSSRNKSNNTGLRILWIPGRRRHNRKGHIEPTRKNTDYYSSNNRHSKNEMWSFGGSKGQEHLIKSDLSGGGSGAEIGSSSPVSQILPASASAVVGVSLQNDDNNMKAGDESNKFQTLETSANNNSKYSTNPNECESTDKESNSKKTLLVNENRIQKSSNSQDDINSIEEITENGDLKLHNHGGGKISLDTPDGGFQQFSHANGKKRSKKKKKKDKLTNNYQEDDDKKNEEDDATVKCLYYTLMCCECTIS